MIKMAKIDLDLDDETFIAIAKEAHKENMTFNSMVNMIISDELIKELKERNDALLEINDILVDIMDEIIEENNGKNNSSRSKSKERGGCSARNNCSAHKTSKRKR